MAAYYSTFTAVMRHSTMTETLTLLVSYLTAFSCDRSANTIKLTISVIQLVVLSIQLCVKMQPFIDVGSRVATTH